MLQKVLLTRRSMLRLSVRSFGGGHAHDDHHDDHGHDDHGDHGHDDHHHHVETADGNHKFLTPAASKKTMVFDGLKASKNHIFALDNLYRHHNDLPMIK